MERGEAEELLLYCGGMFCHQKLTQPHHADEHMAELPIARRS